MAHHAHRTRHARSAPALTERVTVLREAARAAAQETIAIKVTVDQRLGESRACVRETTLLLTALRHVPPV